MNKKESTLLNKVRKDKWFWLVALTILGVFIGGGLTCYIVFREINHQANHFWQAVSTFEKGFDKQEKHLSDAMEQRRIDFEKNRHDFQQHFMETQEKFLQEMTKKQDEFYERRKNWKKESDAFTQENIGWMMAEHEKTVQEMNDSLREFLGSKPLPPLTGKESIHELQRRAVIKKMRQHEKAALIESAANGLTPMDALKKAIPELTPAQIEDIKARRANKYSENPMAIEQQGRSQ